MIDVTPRTFAATLGALSALLMGVAIRRAGTCTVAAVNEIVDERRCGRLLALVAASMIVLCGLALAESFDVLPSLPATAPATRATVWGGLLLGLGASVNGACALGTVARIGAGQWCYVATPIGYYAGCHVAAGALIDKPSNPLYDSPTLHAPVAIVVLLLAVVATLAASALRSQPSHAISGLAAPDSVQARRASWAPHAATAAIGMTFVLLFVLDGAWTYTDTLADLAQGRIGTLPSRALLFGALLLGTMSALITRAMRGARAPASGVTPLRLARCLSGGALMGCASLIIPGGNDSLVLVAMPLLRPYAWIAFAAMCVGIGAVSSSRRLVRARRQRQPRRLA